jgi:hypothetical protein
MIVWPMFVKGISELLTHLAQLLMLLPMTLQVAEQG